MEKRQWHHRLVQLRYVQYRYLFALLLICFMVFVFAYRQNNLTALRLRDELLEVDKQNGDVEASLKKLREFTYSHMNANLSGGANNIYPPIQLKYRYERLIQAEQDKLAKTNAELYTKAQNFCEAQINSRVTINRVPCIQDYLSTNGAATTVAQIPDSLYKFDFVSPIWSPDLAGLSLAAVCFLGLFILIRYAGERWLLWRLRQ